MASVLSPSAAAPMSSVPKSHPFTCNTCQVAFRGHEQQKSHYHTDWHQYNLKRKVASLPPLTSETFAEKVLNAQASTRLERERATFEKLCKPCGKYYYSENAYTNHLGSQKHRQNVASLQVAILRSGGGADGSLANPSRGGDDLDDASSVVSSTFSLGEPASDAPAVSKDVTSMVRDLGISSANGSHATPRPQSPEEAPEGVPEGEPTELPLETCLFCNYSSPTMHLNVKHMSKAHGMFIPEISYLVDLEGLLRYLGQKLLLGNQCLYCNKTKGGLEGIRTHMRDKGHTMLGFDTEEQQVELGQFYDFRSTYSDAGEESSTSDDEESSAPAGTKLKPRGPGENEGWEAVDDGNAGEGWETDSDASSVDSTELTAVPVDPTTGRRRSKDGRHHLSDGWHSHAHHAWHDEYELHLPSGRSAGHRSLAKYYRQNLRNRGLDSKEVRKITDTPYPKDGEHVDVDDEEGDDEEGGVMVSENGDRQVTREERREADRMAMVSRANGGLGMVGVSQAKRKEVTKMEKKTRDEEQRGRRRYEWGNEKRGNMQKHYRDPLLQ